MNEYKQVNVKMPLKLIDDLKTLAKDQGFVSFTEFLRVTLKRVCKEELIPKTVSTTVKK